MYDGPLVQDASQFRLFSKARLGALLALPLTLLAACGTLADKSPRPELLTSDRQLNKRLGHSDDHFLGHKTNCDLFSVPDDSQAPLLSGDVPSLPLIEACVSVMDAAPSTANRVVGYSTIRVKRGEGLSVAPDSLRLREFDSEDKTKGEQSVDRTTGVGWDRPGGKSLVTPIEPCGYKYNDVTSTASFEVTDGRTQPGVTRRIENLQVTAGEGDTLCSHSDLNTLI